MNKQISADINVKILLFLCNWGAHAAFQTLQDERQAIPDEIRMVRTPCTGRIDRAMLLKAFAMGADGVALVGCEPGTCRYGSGTATAQRNTKDLGRILDIMGIGSERLRFATFLPEQSGEMLAFLSGFRDDIRRLGPGGIGTTPSKVADPADDQPGRKLHQLVAPMISMPARTAANAPLPALWP